MSSAGGVIVSFLCDHIRTVRDGEPRAAASTFTQLLNPDRKSSIAGIGKTEFLAVGKAC